MVMGMNSNNLGLAANVLITGPSERSIHLTLNHRLVQCMCKATELHRHTGYSVVNTL